MRGKRYARFRALPSNTYKIPMSKTNKKKFIIPEKFKDVTSFSFTTYGNELMVVFNGFEREADIGEFADYLFGKIKMNYFHAEGPPTIH